LRKSEALDERRTDRWTDRRTGFNTQCSSYGRPHNKKVQSDTCWYNIVSEAELMKTTRNARSHWQHDEAIWTRKCSVNRGISQFILLQSSSVSTRTVAAGRRGKEIDYIVSASQRVTRPIR